MAQLHAAVFTCIGSVKVTHERGRGKNEFETVVRILIIIIVSYWGGRTIRSHQQFPLQRRNASVSCRCARVRVIAHFCNLAICKTLAKS